MSKGIKIEDILELHNVGFSAIEIGLELNCSLSNVSKRLKKLGIKSLRTSNKKWARKNRYKIEELFFEKINNEQKAYVLGLMYADGSVSKDSFYLKMKDEEILLKVKEVLKAEQPVKYKVYNGYYSYILSICSHKMINDLIDKGCFINKTYNLKFPTEEQVPKELVNHFIRGFFDGDGHLGVTDNISTCRFDITSAATEFLSNLRQVLREIALTNGSLSKETNSNTWHLRFSGKQVNQILNWLYKDATIFMQRKYSKFQVYKETHKNRLI